MNTPKDSLKALLLEAKDNLQRMLTSIALTDDERAAVVDGQAALDQLLARLTDIPPRPVPSRVGPASQPQRRACRLRTSGTEPIACGRDARRVLDADPPLLGGGQQPSRTRRVADRTTRPAARFANHRVRAP